MKQTTQECSAKLPKVLTAARDFGLCLGKATSNISTLFFILDTQAQRGHILAQEYQLLWVGILEGDLHQKNGHDFLLYFPAEQEPVISPCLSTTGHELTKICVCRVCSVSIHLRKGLDLCALKIWWIKETRKYVLVLKSCLPEVQTDKCSSPKGLSFSFSRDAQSNRVRARHSGLFAKDLPPECLCTYCHLMKVISLFFPQTATVTRYFGVITAGRRGR